MASPISIILYNQYFNADLRSVNLKINEYVMLRCLVGTQELRALEMHQCTVLHCYSPELLRMRHRHRHTHTHTRTHTREAEVIIIRG